MRAILLAAGMGTRLRPLTLETPKSLTIVNNEPLIERQIRFLKECGINEIVVVTGYLKEKFEYLIDKYGVKLVNNDKYDVYNNIYTMYLVKDYLSDSYVIDADVYINKNFFIQEPKSSLYFSAYREKFFNEWEIQFNDEKYVEKISVINEGSGYILSGVSYWKKEDSKIIVAMLEKAINEGGFDKLYWDDIVRENVDKLNLKIEMLDSSDIYEIDSLEDLQNVKAIVE
ncbi:MAG: NTP transferase domain-containing protein [Clostridium sp.]|uniref:D-glycero-alpha-D-manno-heptose 1-phosphate guanylyltransferase n=1 Tax=Clostridium paraputrificum TaxID=29363 RepID=A0A6N3DC89_9CLOT|nr:sugar phosphate nucleotidyltransferase [Clostridium sp.]MBS5927986.1 NTP transferase domain-containing protein [Clostridium sp.]MBS5987616.1 NTP transferase domain-containing protein [Clostridium sp.]